LVGDFVSPCASTLGAAIPRNGSAVIAVPAFSSLRRVNFRFISSAIFPLPALCLFFDLVLQHQFLFCEQPTSAQGRGYGRILMEFSEWFALAAGYDLITLYTNDAMTKNLEAAFRT
jgi:hypothetical protein